MNWVGIVCSKDGFGCTVVHADDVIDHDIRVPANMKDRGEALSWLTTEAQRFLGALNGVEVCLQNSGRGKYAASAERHEVEACVKIGAFGAGAGLRELTRDQVRGLHGIAKGKGAYSVLLRREDVKARSNSDRRDQYLLALCNKQ